MEGAELERRPVWEDRWRSHAKASDLQFGSDRARLAENLAKRIHPGMTKVDALCVLDALQQQGLPVPVPDTLPPAPVMVTYPAKAGTDGFVVELGRATRRIELYGSDGLTSPPLVYEILKTKLLQDDQFAVELILLDEDTLARVEQRRDARAKFDLASTKWTESLEIWLNARAQRHNRVCRNVSRSSMSARTSTLRFAVVR